MDHEAEDQSLLLVVRVIQPGTPRAHKSYTFSVCVFKIIKLFIHGNIISQ